MKKLMTLALVLMLALPLAFAESLSGEITVISREDGSGTRGAFIKT